MFIETTRGHLVNTEHVVKIFRKGDVDRCTVAGTEETVEVYSSIVDELVAAQSIIPAHPGFTLLSFYPSDSDPEWVDRSPVIAWQVDASSGFHKAIGLDATSNNVVATGILCPDGQVIDPGNTLYPNEDAWREEARRDAEKIEARKKTKIANPVSDAPEAA
jgi:hypothetical protein